ncbi:cation efflux protein [Chlamydoabsidia padenii]|nr:cation efflux protein [Chlamydoabsidia padenii]
MTLKEETTPLLKGNNEPFILPRTHSTCSQTTLLKDKDADPTKKKLIIACSLAFFFFITEVTAGYFANSLALLGDGFHLLSDVASFIVAIVAIYLAEKPPTKRHSFGFYRAQVIAALISVFTIWILTGFLVLKAFHRLTHPAQIDAKIMCATATIGVLVNIVLAYVLGGHHHHSKDGDSKLVFDQESQQTQTKEMRNINLQAAALHVIGDLLASLGVLISSIILWIKPEYSFVDPLCTFLFSIIVLCTTFHLVRDSVVVLMEGVPFHMDIHQVETALLELENVVDVHDLHIWTLSPGKTALCVHLVTVLTSDVSGDDHVLIQAQSLLFKLFDIHHSTIQIESKDNLLGRNDCCLASIQPH